jgi:hypothetical protein
VGGGIRTIKEVLETLSGGQIYPSVVSLDLRPCPLAHRASYVDIAVGLSLVIDCLSFFFHFSILTTIVVSLFFFFYLDLTWVANPSALGLVTMGDVRPGRGLADPDAWI